jgi:hypothetical protein
MAGDAQTFDTKIKPLGCWLNNPGNMRPGPAWEGLNTPSVYHTTGNGDFAWFSSAVWGFRAIFRDYMTLFDRGINTITKLVNTWAPAADKNNDVAYISALCRATGYGADEVINLKSWDIAKNVCYAMVTVEQGAFEGYFTQAQMAEGAYRCGITDAPAPIVKKLGTAVASYGSAGTGLVAAATTQVQTIQQHPHGWVVTTLLVVASIGLAGIAGVLAQRGQPRNAS